MSWHILPHPRITRDPSGAADVPSPVKFHVETFPNRQRCTQVTWQDAKGTVWQLVWQHNDDCCPQLNVAGVPVAHATGVTEDPLVLDWQAADGQQTLLQTHIRQKLGFVFRAVDWIDEARTQPRRLAWGKMTTGQMPIVVRGGLPVLQRQILVASVQHAIHRRSHWD